MSLSRKGFRATTPTKGPRAPDPELSFSILRLRVSPWTGSLPDPNDRVTTPGLLPGTRNRGQMALVAHLFSVKIEYCN